MVLPNFLVCGAAKSGTTSVYHYLSAHPDVFMSGRKEPNFFSRHYDQGISWYTSFFEDRAGETAIGEASPSTMAHAEITAKRVAEQLPHAKLIFLLRNPIDRIWSDYWFAVNQGRFRAYEHNSFSKLIREETNVKGAFWPYDVTARKILVGRGRYCTQLMEFDKYFEQSQMLIVFNEDLHENFQQTISQIYEFIGVRTSFVPPDTKSNTGNYPKNLQVYRYALRLWLPLKEILPEKAVQGSTTMRQFIRSALFHEEKPEMKDSDRDYLHTLYDSEIVCLEERTGRDLSHWR